MDTRRSIELGKRKRRKPTADQVSFLERKPDLDSGAFVIARAYVQLSTCRPLGGMGGIGPIPATAVWEWEDRNGIRSPAVRAHFEAVIAGIDAATLRRANKPPVAPKGESDKPKRRRQR